MLVTTVAAGRTLLTVLPEHGSARLGPVLLFAFPTAVATASVGVIMSRVASVDQWAIILVAAIGAVLGGCAGAHMLEQPAT